MPDLIHHTRRPAHGQSASSDERLQHALAERERFLEQNPHLRAYQAEIDRLLDLSGDSQGRMTVLGTLMQGKLLEMRDQFKRLNRYLQPSAVAEPGVPIEVIDMPKAPADCCGQPCL